MNHAVKKTLLVFLQLATAGIGFTVLGLASAYLYLSPNLPSVESIREVKLQTPLRIYSSDNKLIGEFGEKRRNPVKLDNVPKPFIDALLAAEDRDFYSHNGVSIRGLARAATELITTGEKGSGGSTLTMQLTRNVFFSLEKRFARKFNEILLSIKLERELTKNEILELYVNYMFLGKRAYGIQAAANVYYGKNLDELSLAQQAMIAGLFQGPSTQNPIVNPEKAFKRRNWILRRMKELELINEDAYVLASNEPVTATYHGSPYDTSAPYVAELAREKIIRSFGLKAYTEGYRVYTTVDSNLQLAAQEAVTKGLMAYDKRHGFRGAEQTLDVIEAPSETATNSSDIRDVITNYDDLLTELNTIPSYAGIEPAVVIGISDQSLILIAKNGETVRLDWENGLSDSRRFITENRRGPKPEKAKDVANIGDVLRIKKHIGNQWQLVQLPEVQAALIALNPLNGGIKSLVGGFDFQESNFNRATQAYRQPGSNFKPFIYTAALEHDLTAATLINDAPIVFNDAALEGTWRPENDSGRFYGPTRVRKALYLSRNLVSIRLLQRIGIARAINSLERFGFDTKKLPRDLSLSLGTHAVTPIDLATAWASFANGGHKIDAHLIQRVQDIDDNIIYEAFPKTVCKTCDNTPETKKSIIELDHELGSEFSPEQIQEVSDIDESQFDIPLMLKRQLGLLEDEDYPKAPRIIDDRVTFIVDSMLQDVIKRGTGKRAKVLQRSDIAGKTGTTNGPNDAWFSGYNEDIIATTWVGFDQNKPLGSGEYGGSAALPIWIDFMNEALKGSTDRPRSQPPGVMTVKIDPETGARARYDDPDAIYEYFRMENVPELLQGNTASGGNGGNDFSEDIF